MGKDYLKTIHGIAAIILIILGFAGLFFCSFVWSGGDVYFLFYLGGAPGQIYVLLALLITWGATIAVTILQVSGQDILESMGKMKLLIYHGIIFIIILIAAAVESYYVKSYSDGNYYWRVVIVMIIEWVMVVLNIIQIVFVILQ